MARQKKVCIECGGPMVVYMRCQRHAGFLIRNHPEEVARLQGLTKEEKQIEYEKLTRTREQRMDAERPRWEYTNDAGEAELARLAALERP